MTKKEYIQLPFATIKSAVNKLVDFIKPTFGPNKNNVILNSPIGSNALDDGVKIASLFELENKFENAVIDLVKQVAKKTNDRVGDGTTGSLVLLQGILNELPEFFSSNKVITELKTGATEAVAKLKEVTKSITTQEELEAVSKISCNDDKLAKMISEIIFKIGLDGAVTINDSGALETNYTITDGFQFNRGFISSYMVNNSKGEAVLENPKIVIMQGLVGIKEITPVLQKLAEQGETKVLLIADDFDMNLVSVFVAMKLRGGMNIVAVKSPGYASDKDDIMKDVAIVCGNEENEYGCAKKVIVSKDKTTIINGVGTKVQDRITELKALETSNDFDKEKIKERVASLTGGIAIINIGGLTESERDIIKDKVEDSVNATRVAYRGGVVRGAGVELSEITTSSELLNNALKYPSKVLKENSVESLENVSDPTEVLIAGLESAVSIASILISTKGIFVEYENDTKI